MTEPDTNLFARYIPGFEFLQNLTRQTAGSAAPGAASSVPGMPPLSHWVAPTFDVEELDKRIQDLKAVHFWLDQNTKALAATIQALEVQKMTLATLKSMNVSMQDMADAFKMSPTSSPASSPPAAPEPAPAPTPEAEPETAPSTPPVVDPMQWWSALTQQFQTIATGAMQDMAQHVQASAEAVAAAQATAQTPVAKPTRAKARRPAAPKASRPAAHQSGQKTGSSVTAKATKAVKTAKTPPSAAPSAKSGATKSTNAPARAKPATRSR